MREIAIEEHEIVQTARKCSILKNVSDEEILNGLQDRESLGSTGFGKGIAIPHCRLKSVSDFVVGIMTVPAGVDFEALDGEAVNFIIFIHNVKLASFICHTLSAI